MKNLLVRLTLVGALLTGALGVFAQAPASATSVPYSCYNNMVREDGSISDGYHTLPAMRFAVSGGANYVARTVYCMTSSVRINYGDWTSAAFVGSNYNSYYGEWTGGSWTVRVGPYIYEGCSNTYGGFDCWAYTSVPELYGVSTSTSSYYYGAYTRTINSGTVSCLYVIYDVSGDPSDLASCMDSIVSS